MLQESRVDDCWNVDVDRSLADSWTGFTKFTLLCEKTLQKDFCGPEERLAKNQPSTRPDYLWPEMWSSMSKAAQKKGKASIGYRKPKLDNARKLRGIYFIDPDDGELKETI